MLTSLDHPHRHVPSCCKPLPMRTWVTPQPLTKDAGDLTEAKSGHITPPLKFSRMPVTLRKQQALQGPTGSGPGFIAVLISCLFPPHSLSLLSQTCPLAVPQILMNGHSAPSVWLAVLRSSEEASPTTLFKGDTTLGTVYPHSCLFFPIVFMVSYHTMQFI